MACGWRISSFRGSLSASSISCCIASIALHAATQQHDTKSPKNSALCILAPSCPPSCFFTHCSGGPALHILAAYWSSHRLTALFMSPEHPGSICLHWGLNFMSICGCIRVRCRLVNEQRQRNADAERLEAQAFKARMEAQAAADRIQQCQNSLHAAESKLVEKKHEISRKVSAWPMSLAASSTCVPVLLQTRLFLLMRNAWCVHLLYALLLLSLLGFSPQLYSFGTIHWSQMPWYSKTWLCMTIHIVYHASNVPFSNSALSFSIYDIDFAVESSNILKRPVFDLCIMS